MLQTTDTTITNLRQRILSVLDDADDYFRFLAFVSGGGDLDGYFDQHLRDVRRVRADIDRLVNDATGTFTSRCARQRVRNVIESYLAFNLESPGAGEALLAHMYAGQE